MSIQEEGMAQTKCWLRRLHDRILAKKLEDFQGNPSHSQSWGSMR
jgi:hypothetical protein